ncbi:alpha/beta hydrolase [Luteipulveratus flavus]|uniref:Alpha/beta fold hydrolase n=1 Tax=Luteipulveratus flavus TaxID=3031728 RepID=A0ABT6CBV4_9MICO|nr:alpha/beta fold hydrolase [Luteipulveratus sp. YIM 133296]MDF8265797.1 alpha/beta fold hydrolase [Luteipulveratus sp. YIM 133296]
MQILPGAEPWSFDGSSVGVLVCHGFTGTTQSVRPVAQRCAEEGWTVRMPRLPGHGTTWQDLNRTVWTDWYAEVEVAYAELQERCSQVVVVGLSLGGSLVTLLAQEHSDVAGLVLVNPAYAPKDPRLKALPLAKHLVPSLAAIGGDIRKPGVTELAYDRTPLKSLHSAVRLWRRVSRDLPSVTAPILLMHSPEDHVVEPYSSELLLARVSSTDVTEILLEDSFHVATLDHDAERILEETVAFVRRVSTS